MAVPRTLALFPPDPALPEQPRKHLRERSVERRRKRPVPQPVSAFRQPPGSAPRSHPKSSQLWLAIRLSRLPLDCLTRAAENPAGSKTFDTPLAIVDAEDRVQTVLACNAAASAAGVRAGQPLNAALALESRLATLPRNPIGEQELLERIAAWCHRFTPVVSLEEPDELLLEVKGSLHLFGGARGLMELVAQGLQTRDIEAAISLTPTPRSAVWLARSSKGSGREAMVERIEDLSRLLQPLPLQCLRWPAETLDRLVSMGVRTTGDLFRLPRGGLARRIGPHWLAQLDQALGRHPEVRRRFRAPERYDERVSLDCEIETIDRLGRTIAPLLQRLQHFLRVREAAISALVLQLEHRAGPSTRVRLGLAAPSSDINHLHSLLGERLSRVDLRAPVVALRLRSSVLLASVAASGNLPCAPSRQTVACAEGASGEQPALAMPTGADVLPRLIERLQARLGRAAVFGLSSCPEHRPERAWRAIDLSMHGMVPRKRCNARQASRPLWLFADPEPIPDLRPDASRGGNADESSSANNNSWRIESGPERIESGWWDGGDLMRDYFIARDPRGIRSWVFRDRRKPNRWYRHGLFG